MADDRYLIAVASSDGIVVNNHFGHAATFYVFEASDDRIELKEKREVTPVCDFVLVSKIGDGARAVLESKGIACYEIPGIITDSIDKLIRYEKVNNLFL